MKKIFMAIVVLIMAATFVAHTEVFDFEGSVELSYMPNGTYSAVDTFFSQRNKGISMYGELSGTLWMWDRFYVGTSTRTYFEFPVTYPEIDYTSFPENDVYKFSLGVILIDQGFYTMTLSAEHMCQHVVIGNSLESIEQNEIIYSSTYDKVTLEATGKMIENDILSLDITFGGDYFINSSYAHKLETTSYYSPKMTVYGQAKLTLWDRLYAEGSASKLVGDYSYCEKIGTIEFSRKSYDVNERVYDTYSTWMFSLEAGIDFGTIELGYRLYNDIPLSQYMGGIDGYAPYQEIYLKFGVEK